MLMNELIRCPVMLHKITKSFQNMQTEIKTEDIYIPLAQEQCYVDA